MVAHWHPEPHHLLSAEVSPAGLQHPPASSQVSAGRGHEWAGGGGNIGGAGLGVQGCGTLWLLLVLA